MKKTILTIVALLLLGTNAFAQQPTDLQAQQKKVNQIKQTQQGKHIMSLVDRYSAQYKVDSKLVKAIILVESGFNPNATSKCGAKGLGQMMDNTFYARKVGTNPYNPEQNVHALCKHLAGLQAAHKGNTSYMLASYNAGGGNVNASLRKYGRIPSYTQGYVNRVQSYRNSIVF